MTRTGRPKELKGAQPVSAMLEERDVEALDRWVHHRGCRSRSEALRQMIDALRDLKHPDVRPVKPNKGAKNA